MPSYLNEELGTNDTLELILHHLRHLCDHFLFLGPLLFLLHLVPHDKCSIKESVDGVIVQYMSQTTKSRSIVYIK